jgi:hypothetical protein
MFHVIQSWAWTNPGKAYDRRRLKTGPADPSQLSGMGKSPQNNDRPWFCQFCTSASCLATLSSELCGFIARLRMAMSVLRAIVSFYYEKHGYTMGEPPP